MRVGLATGLVVVGELIGAGEAQERNVVGETPNLAARLQSAAAPNTVVVAATTRRLAGDLFEYEAIEPAKLKGFQDPVSAWRVLRERTFASRFEALRAASVTPLVGRQEEMELLQRRWQQLKDGEGRVVLLAGEPGIGKSRLTAALEDQIEHEAHICLRYFCQPHHQGSALQPIVAQLQHAAGFARDDTPADKRAKLERLLAPEAANGAAEIELFAELLGLADASLPRGRPRIRSVSAAAVLTALIERLEALARRAPVLMLFEDVHWADPTSVELADADHRAAADPAGPARHHVPAGLSAALDRPAARHDADAQSARRSASAPCWSITSPAAKRCRRDCSTRSSSAPTACRCSSKS